MKFRASSSFLKQMCSAVVAMVKAKSMAVKSKTSALRTRLLVLRLLQNKKLLMKAINHKIHALMGQEKGEGGAHSAEDHDKAIVLYDAAKNAALTNPTDTEPMYCYDDDDDDYPDLRHSLFDLEEEEEEDDDELGNTTGSVIDLVKNSKEDGSEFRLEDEIDHAADVFIKRFHRQMRLQKLESFKRYQEMLLRSV
ncbi:uncharacterized protein LOC104000642 [Musa acuminata AAA Group]|uniref:uncharacterized protein LOC104000642 n=1 Tax=Musa acuminata AAA Group TaxID=214697 RepID=UPI0031DD744E